MTALYGAIVAQARHPAFYDAYGVADTVDGRFDLLLLHLFLYLRGPARPSKDLSQAVFDRFCRDMDHSLREMGVGDLAVPSRMRKIGEAFYGRMQAYDAAVARGDDDALTSALTRNIFGQEAPAAARLARYVRDALAGQGGDPLRPQFPQPDAIPVAPQATRTP